MTVHLSFLEVTLTSDEDFLKVKETLSRIGIASRKDRVLYQSCHILHKQGKYYIVHFKELFRLDGNPTAFSEEDEARRNTIASLLQEWNLVRIVEPDRFASPMAKLAAIKILPYKEKDQWTLESKYTIGKRKAV